MTELDFPGWLLGEINDRGWTQAELARRSGLSTAQVSRVLNHEYRPGPDFCRGTAAALNIPVARVFRFAGLLPSYPVKNQRAEFFEIYDTLSDADQDALFRMARMMRVCSDMESESLDS